MQNNMKNGKTKSKETIPLYRRLEYQIKNQILSGQFEPGQKLPTHDEMVKLYGVSMITVRGALAELEGEGLIYRLPGKGTFVSDEIPTKKHFIVFGSVYDIVNDAKRFDARTLEITTKKVNETRCPKTIREFLGITNDESIGVIRRIRLLENVPIYFLENYVPKDIVNKVGPETLNQKPLLKILKEETGLSIGRGEMYIEAVPAEPDVADILQCQIFDPLILMQVFYWYSSGDPFEVVNLYMRHDYFKYKVDLNAKDFDKI